MEGRDDGFVLGQAVWERIYREPSTSERESDGWTATCVHRPDSMRFNHMNKCRGRYGRSLVHLATFVKMSNYSPPASTDCHHHITCHSRVPA